MNPFDNTPGMQTFRSQDLVEYMKIFYDEFFQLLAHDNIRTVRLTNAYFPYVCAANRPVCINNYFNIEREARQFAQSAQSQVRKFMKDYAADHGDGNIYSTPVGNEYKYIMIFGHIDDAKNIRIVNQMATPGMDLYERYYNNNIQYINVRVPIGFLSIDDPLVAPNFNGAKYPCYDLSCRPRDVTEFFK